MKKLIAAIVIASVGAAVAETPWLVYNYKASIKRLDISMRFDKSAKAVAEKYNVKSDTIEGYVTLPVCKSCLDKTTAQTQGISTTVNSELNDFSNQDYYQGKAYLVLKGNKYAAPKRYVLVAPATAMAAVFGSEAYASDVTGTKAGAPIKPSQLTKSWMALDFVTPQNGQANPFQDFDPSTIIKGIGKDDNNLLYNGFFGITNNGSDGVKVQNTGFGTAKVISDTKSSYSICGGVTTTTNCTIVNTVSGTLVGYPTYVGPCSKTALWDLCNPTDTGMQVSTKPAVISGTWSLKYNQALSKLTSSVEDEILTKLGLAKNGGFVIDKDGKVTKITETGKLVDFSAK